MFAPLAFKIKQLYFISRNMLQKTSNIKQGPLILTKTKQSPCVFIDLGHFWAL